MHSHVNPYINFTGQARDALEFYHSVLGGELTLSTFGEYKMAGMPAEQIMHGQIVVDGKIVLMCSDAPMGGEEHKGFAVSLSGNDDKELRGYWERLQDGAQVVTPLEKQMWGDHFGQLVDKFGVMWMVDIAPPHRVL